MLNALKNHHIKWILWALVIIIVPAFVFFGAASLSSNKKNTLASIKGHDVSSQEFRKYLELARIDMLINSGERRPKNINTPVMEQQAWQYYLLLWKAARDNINISDREVVLALQNYLFGGDKLDPRAYNQFVKYRLRISPRTYEEYLRKKLSINRLFENYVSVDVSEEEILDAYKKDNEKAKIAYLEIPFDQIGPEIEISDEQIDAFYQKNKDQFREEPKVKIKYIYINENDYPSIKENLENAVAEAEKIADIAESIQGLDLKETDFISVRSPIEGIGWEPEVLQKAFSLEQNQISPLTRIHNGYLIFTKLDQRQARIPEASEIKDTLSQKIKE